MPTTKRTASGYLLPRVTFSRRAITATRRILLKRCYRHVTCTGRTTPCLGALAAAWRAGVVPVCYSAARLTHCGWADATPGQGRTPTTYAYKHIWPVQQDIGVEADRWMPVKPGASHRLPPSLHTTYHNVAVRMGTFAIFTAHGGGRTTNAFLNTYAPYHRRTHPPHTTPPPLHTYHTHHTSFNATTYDGRAGVGAVCAGDMGSLLLQRHLMTSAWT